MKRSRMEAVLVGAVVASAALAGSVQAAPPTAPDAGVMVLMDRSGSMASKITNCGGLPGEVYKWQCAAQKAIDWILLNDTLIGSGSEVGTYKYWFWQLRYFAPGDVVEKDPTPYSRAEILARLQSYVGPTENDSNTPLAQVACDAMDMIRQEVLPRRYLRLETDGLENQSDPAHKCAGTHSATSYAATLGTLVTFTFNDPPTNSVVKTANALAVPSWESNMLAMGISGLLALPPPDPGFYTATQRQAYEPPSPNKPVIFQIDYFDDWVPPGSSVRAAAAPGVDLLSGAAGAASVSAGASAVNPNEPYAAFLGGLSEVSGGRMIRYRMDGGGVGGTPSFPHVVPGDVNDSGCVDGADLTALLAKFGRAVSAADPATYPADVTFDGIVDVHDYRLVQSQWGVGCATPPTPAPLPSQVIFGFEDASKWSSPQAPLSNKLSPVSGGTYSLNVAGRGWRELTSVNLSTSTLQGVTSKLAYDVYIPAEQSNPYWLGQTLFFVSCPSARIYNQAIGSAELTGRPLGRFSTVQFTLPTNVKQAMLTAHTDLSLKVVINANDPNYVLDSMRFVP